MQQLKAIMSDETVLTAKSFDCEACMSRRSENCTAPTNTGRTEVEWFHYAREGKLYVAARAMGLEVISE